MTFPAIKVRALVTYPTSVDATAPITAELTGGTLALGYDASSIAEETPADPDEAFVLYREGDTYRQISITDLVGETPDAPAQTIKGNSSVSTGPVEDMTPATVALMMEASQAVAEAGTASNALMSPRRVKQAIQNGEFFTAPGSGAEARTFTAKAADFVNVFDYMTAAQRADVVAGTALLDVAAAIQAAINSLGGNGGTVFLPGGWYRINSGISLGDGNYGNTPSTKNGIKLVGCGGGFGVSGALVPTVITWGGSAGTTYMFTVKGRISDVEIGGMFLRCQENCNGIYAKAFSGSRFHHLKISQPRAYGFAVIGGDPPVTNYNIANSFDTITIDLSRASSVGFYLDGYYDNATPYLIDTWASTVNLMQVNVASGATNAVGCWLKFCDSMLWTKCYFDAADEATAVGLIFDALANNDFPVGHVFVSCHPTSIAVYEDGSHFIRTNTFIAHGSFDGETVPAHAKLVGFTEQGALINNFFTGFSLSASVAATAWTSAACTIAATSGTFTSVAGTVRSYSFGKFAFFHLTIVITTNGTAAGAITAALPQNAKSAAVISGWNSTDNVPVFGVMTASANTLTIRSVTGSYPGADGKTIVISGCYEIA